MDKDIAKVRKEMRDHPERFDFAGLPPGVELTPGQLAEAERLTPDWLKEMIKCQKNKTL